MTETQNSNPHKVKMYQAIERLDDIKESSQSQENQPNSESYNSLEEIEIDEMPSENDFILDYFKSGIWDIFFRDRLIKGELTDDEYASADKYYETETDYDDNDYADADIASYNPFTDDKETEDINPEILRLFENQEDTEETQKDVQIEEEPEKPIDPEIIRIFEAQEKSRKKVSKEPVIITEETKLKTLEKKIAA